MLIESIPELESWSWYVNKAFKMLEIIPKILTYIKENPGCLQKRLKKAIAYNDGNLIANTIYYLEQTRKLKRVKAGNSYRLYYAEEIKI